MSKYDEIYRQSIDSPESFWGTAAEDLHWDKKWDVVLDPNAKPVARWFVGGQINTCYNAVDRHVESGRADQLAIIYDSPVTNTQQKISYRELKNRVAKFAGALKKHGAKKGDRVIIYMPMIPEAAIAMLACARIGAIHSVVFGGFAANELATRIDDAKPVIIVSASCGIEPGRVVKYKPLLDEAIKLAQHQVNCCILKARQQAPANMIEGRDFDWDTEENSAEPADCVLVAATDPLYILYTSGTTGEPKGVIRDNGGHAVAMLWSMKNIYNIDVTVPYDPAHIRCCPVHITGIDIINIFHRPQHGHRVSAIIANNAFWFTGSTGCVKDVQRVGGGDRHTVGRFSTVFFSVPVKITALDHVGRGLLACF